MESESLDFRPITNRPILYSFELKCPNIKIFQRSILKLLFNSLFYNILKFGSCYGGDFGERGGVVVHVMPNGMSGLVVADQRATGRTQSGRMLLSLETSWGQLGSTPARFLIGAWKSYETRACVCWRHT